MPDQGQHCHMPLYITALQSCSCTILAAQAAQLQAFQGHNMPKAAWQVTLV